jgi:hypothetical protein
MWLQDQINGSRTSLESHKLSHNGAGVSVAVADRVRDVPDPDVERANAGGI